MTDRDGPARTLGPLKGNAVHPLYDGEFARLRHLEFAQEARQHRSNHVQLIWVRAARSHHDDRVGSNVAPGLRHRIGLALIGAGLRFVDPEQALAGRPDPRI